MQYKIIEARYAEDLEKLVNTHLKNGGKLLGGLSVLREKNFYDRYSQPMLIKTN